MKQRVQEKFCVFFLHVLSLFSQFLHIFFAFPNKKVFQFVFLVVFLIFLKMVFSFVLHFVLFCGCHFNGLRLRLREAVPDPSPPPKSEVLVSHASPHIHSHAKLSGMGGWGSLCLFAVFHNYLHFDPFQVEHPVSSYKNHKMLC